MIAVGVGTHKREHVVRALDDLGQLRGGLTITTDPAGYLALRPDGFGRDSRIMMQSRQSASMVSRCCSTSARASSGSSRHGSRTVLFAPKVWRSAGATRGCSRSRIVSARCPDSSACSTTMLSGTP